jgi:hypothetical protein
VSFLAIPQPGVRHDAQTISRFRSLGATMLTSANFPFVSEFYVIDKSIQVVVFIKGEYRTIRIDALHRFGKDLGEKYYSARAWILVNPGDFELFVSYELPSVNGNSSDDVLALALSFIKERCEPHTC